MCKRIFIILIVLFLLLLSSCDKGPKSMFLVSEAGSELYFNHKGSNAEVVIQKEVQDMLLKKSGMSLAEFYATVAEGSINETEFLIPNDFILRSNYVTLLLSELGEEELMEAYREDGSRIKNSEIFRRINGASAGFDERLLSIVKGDEFNLYSLYYTFNGEETWDEISLFLTEWIRRISI